MGVAFRDQWFQYKMSDLWFMFLRTLCFSWLWCSRWVYISHGFLKHATYGLDRNMAVKKMNDLNRKINGFAWNGCPIFCKKSCWHSTMPILNYAFKSFMYVLVTLYIPNHLNSLWPIYTIWGHKSGSTLAQVMAWCLMAPNHYLNRCWLIFSKVQWHSSECNFTRDTSVISHWN